MTTDEKMNPKRTARIAGFLYLLAFPFNLFAMLYVPSNIIVPGDAATTANNIVASEGLYRSGIFSFLIGQVIFLFMVLLLYKLLKPVNKRHAVLMVILILVSIPIAMLNTLNQFAALLLLSGADYLAVFGALQLQTLVPLFLDLHEYGIQVASIFWGLWLLPLGLLVFRSGFLPRILGILLIIGFLGYMLDFVTFFYFPDFDAPIVQLTTIGELLFPLWLLIMGVNAEEWERRALESA